MRSAIGAGAAELLSETCPRGHPVKPATSAPGQLSAAVCTLMVTEGVVVVIPPVMELDIRVVKMPSRRS